MVQKSPTDSVVGRGSSVGSVIGTFEWKQPIKKAF